LTRQARPRTELLDTRASGVLLHPTSLPGRHGVGDVGAEAHRFAEHLAAAGQSWWQMLPVGPIGAGNSPYSSPSSFAGSPLLVSLHRLVEDGLLTAQDIEPPHRLARAKKADYRGALRFREPRLRAACKRFKDRASPALKRELDTFRHAHSEWLADYALFRALERETGARSWTRWPKGLRRRNAAALAAARERLHAEVEYHELLQFLFDHQWRALRAHCRELGIRLLGDVPMFVAHDAAEVWQMSEAFQLDENGKKLVQAGVPPDNFSKTGQLWGNPLYDWNALRKTRYRFWVTRLKLALGRFDAVRLDHFIGFHRVWEVPARAKTAGSGSFDLVPGAKLLARLSKELGGLPFVAEDLGIVTPEVHALRDQFALPGMRVLQFGFDEGASEHLPHRHPPRTLACTGTHDTNTIVGWFSGLGARDKIRVCRYANGRSRSIHWDLIRVLMASVANLLIIPAQDVLALDGSARMNVPGTARGNWEWRLAKGQLGSRTLDELGQLAADFERFGAFASDSPNARRSKS
jgi:4-alpha-glucanotransferase